MLLRELMPIRAEEDESGPIRSQDVQQQQAFLRGDAVNNTSISSMAWCLNLNNSTKKKRHLTAFRGQSCDQRKQFSLIKVIFSQGILGPNTRKFSRDPRRYIKRYFKRRLDLYFRKMLLEVRWIREEEASYIETRRGNCNTSDKHDGDLKMQQANPHTSIRIIYKCWL